LNLLDTFQVNNSRLKILFFVHINSPASELWQAVKPEIDFSFLRF